MAKMLYQKVFHLVVAIVNTTLSPTCSQEAQDKAGFVGVLDIFGFEIFKKNRFSQASAAA